jgi:hypothetical protein
MIRRPGTRGDRARLHRVGVVSLGGENRRVRTGEAPEIVAAIGVYRTVRWADSVSIRIFSRSEIIAFFLIPRLSYPPFSRTLSVQAHDDNGCRISLFRVGSQGQGSLRVEKGESGLAQRSAEAGPQIRDNCSDTRSRFVRCIRASEPSADGRRALDVSPVEAEETPRTSASCRYAAPGTMKMGGCMRVGTESRAASSTRWTLGQVSGRAGLPGEILIGT